MVYPLSVVARYRYVILRRRMFCPSVADFDRGGSKGALLVKIVPPLYPPPNEVHDKAY